MSEQNQDVTPADSPSEDEQGYRPRHARQGVGESLSEEAPRHGRHARAEEPAQAAVDARAERLAEEPTEEPVDDYASVVLGEQASEPPQSAEEEAPDARAGGEEQGESPQSFSPEPPDAPTGFERLNANAMGSVAEQRAENNKRWQDVRPKTPGGKHELHHTRGWYQAVVVCVVMAVVLCGVGAGVTYYLELWGGKTVPAVVGLTSANAQERLTQKGFEVETTTVPSDNGNDRVISVEPGTGTRIDDGSTVMLTVGENRVLPSVVGLSSQEARQALADAGATNVRLVYQPSTEDEGVVLSVSPSEGSTFVSSDQITLTIAQLPTVPDVVGKSLSEALRTLSDAGLVPTLEFVPSGSHAQGYVEATSPAAGRRSDERGSVKVTVVSTQPSSEYDLPGYLSALPRALSSYLSDAGYSLYVGYEDAEGHVVQRMDGANGNTVVVSSTPWMRDVSQADATTGAADALGKETTMEGLGVSMSIAAAQCPQGGATFETLGQVLELCGLTGQPLETCDENSIRLTESAESISTDFYSAYGEEGDYAWDVVLYVDDQGATEAFVVYAPKTLFDTIDTSYTQGSMASYMAWALLMS